MKKRISWLLVFVMLLSMAACAEEAPRQSTPGGTAPVQTSPVQAALEMLDLQTMLYLLDDMTGSGFGAYCYQEEITPEKMSMVLGREGFSRPFEAARAYLPTMNTTPFVLAVFRLAEGADAQAFADALKAEANPDRWICVRAEVTETAVLGRMVLFVMGNEMTAASLKDAFGRMQGSGFRVEENLVDHLKDISMIRLYQKLYEKYSVSQYGFLDGEDLGPVGAGFGLDALDSRQIADSLVDTGYFPANEFDMERSYLLAMFRLTPEADSAAFAQEVKTAVDIADLKGEGQQYLLAWSEDVVVYYVGTGSLAWFNSTLDSELGGIYRMETEGVEP